MQTYPIKLTYHVRSYYFGERLIPELLGKRDAPAGVVAETWEISDCREARATVTNGPYAGASRWSRPRETRKVSWKVRDDAGRYDGCPDDEANVHHQRSWQQERELSLVGALSATADQSGA